MSTEEFTRDVTVPAPPERIFAHLAEPESYLGLSPLLVAVRDIVRGGDGIRYVAVERFRILGPLRWDNPIRVTMTFPEPGRRIVSEVHSPGGVRLTATVVLTPMDAGTQITETVRVTYPRPLRPLVIGQAAKAQRHRLAELARRMTVSSVDESKG
ncbi:SRPBCC family protein [Streptomyces sp. TRM66268-LWL]|uniref:SRPBCC family protein n=1 Tax=Streptomyces polyasparticus TaxID=2767826 RepID=A0ABR7ST39_9ACTN|nr:SRPBCC family protein [Streptomyces polyasparticus]MBC9718651.1 SRPBCC family protein [Streptomyces polyasparticus]